MERTTKKIFMELHKDMPRQGPGGNEWTKKAFASIKGLPEKAEIADIGCGPGQQTICLAGLTDGNITAVDNNKVYFGEMEPALKRNKLESRIHCHWGDMNKLKFKKESLDLIWSEGAIYIIGFQNGLEKWNKFLKPGGFMAVTELAWLKDGAPDELVEFWKENYPDMMTSERNIVIIKKTGYELIDHFPLPKEAWWTDYYRYLEAKIMMMEKEFGEDEIAREVFDSEKKEMELHRKYSDFYGYVFYIMRKPTE